MCPGLVNRVTKGPIAGETNIGGTVSADSFGASYIATDTNIDLGSAGLRLNAFYESLDNHRDAFGGDRYAINPVVGINLGEESRIQLGYEYVRDDRVVDRGIPSAFAGTIATPAGQLSTMLPGAASRSASGTRSSGTGFPAIGRNIVS